MPIVGPVAPVVGPAAPALDNAPAAVSPDVPAVGHADMAADIPGAANPAVPVFKYEEGMSDLLPFYLCLQCIQPIYASGHDLSHLSIENLLLTLNYYTDIDLNAQ